MEKQPPDIPLGIPLDAPSIYPQDTPRYRGARTAVSDASDCGRYTTSIAVTAPIAGRKRSSGN
jgi:hypothetical protein